MAFFWHLEFAALDTWSAYKLTFPSLGSLCPLYWGYRGLATSFARDNQTYKQIALASVQACSSIILDGFPFLYMGVQKGWPQAQTYRKDTHIETNLPGKLPLLSSWGGLLNLYTWGLYIEDWLQAFLFAGERYQHANTSFYRPYPSLKQRKISTHEIPLCDSPHVIKIVNSPRLPTHLLQQTTLPLS